VWDADYLAGYHLVSDPSPGIPDATGNGRGLTAYGGMDAASLVDLPIGVKGIAFDGSDDYLNYIEASDIISARPLTMETYGYTPAAMSNYVIPSVAFSNPA